MTDRPSRRRAGRDRLPSVVGLAWLLILAFIVGLAVAYRAAPLVGYELVVVRGSSMAPAIPLGALAAVRRATIEDVVTGMVVTIRADNGVLITHRVVRVAEAGTETFLEMRGDANASADRTPVPGRAVVGIVDGHVPWLGYVVALLSTPSGLLSIMSALCCLYVAMLLLEPIEPVGTRPRPVGHATTT